MAFEELTLRTMALWWFSLVHLSEAHTTIFSLPLLNRMGEENEMEKLVVCRQGDYILINTSNPGLTRGKLI